MLSRAPGTVRRSCATTCSCAPCRPRGPAPLGEALPAGVRDVLRDPGRPLDARLRAALEPRFGHDFGRVRVHAGAAADAATRALDAAAYTAGSHVVVAGAAANDVRVMAHELAHVVQGGAVDAGLTLGRPDDPAEREADAAAAVVAAGGRVGGLRPAPNSVVRRRPGRATAPSAPSPLLPQPCADPGAVQGALAEARIGAREAVAGLQALLAIWGREPATTQERSASLALARGFSIAFDKTVWVSLLGMDPGEVAALDARDRAATATILANFREIEADLPHYAGAPWCPNPVAAGTPCFGCVPAPHPRCREGAVAWVPEPFIGSPSSAVLFCPGFFDLGAPEAGDTLLHEIAHLQAFGARDRLSPTGTRYYGCPLEPEDPRGPGLRGPAEFIPIADAYRCFVATRRESAAAFVAIERSERAARDAVRDVVEPRPSPAP